MRSPAVGINAVFVAVATPAFAPYGIGGLIAAGALGFVLGTIPARWLARRINEGLRE